MKQVAYSGHTKY